MNSGLEKTTTINIDLFKQISEFILESRKTMIVAINNAMVITYWNIGKIIVEDELKGSKRAEYGKEILKELSKKLINNFGIGFDERNLRKMRQFFTQFPKWDSVSTELSWTHYRRLIRLKDNDSRQWYINESIANNWSARALDRQISNLYYERLLSSKDKTPLKNEALEKTNELQVDVKNYLRDPYIFDFLNLPNQSLLESNIEEALINNLQKFLLELGRGFAFVYRQQRLSVENQDFYIDLVFYNFKLKCFLLIDLKLGKLTHQDVGQMDTYVRIYDKYKKEKNDNPTIGLILCSEKSEAVAKYSVLNDNKQLFSSKYLSYLPTEEELRIELLKERNLLLDGGIDE